MKRIASALMIVSIGYAGAAMAQDSPQKRRSALMEQNGNSLKVVSDMLKGERAYDAAAAADALKAIVVSVDEFVTLFPEGSIEGTDAKPEILQNKADFNAKAAQAKENSIKAAAAAGGGMEALQPAVIALSRSCQGCHESYRKEDN